MTANKTGLVFFLAALLCAIYVDNFSQRTWKEQSYLYDTYTNHTGDLAYKFRGTEVVIPTLVDYSDSPLRQQALNDLDAEPSLTQQWVKTADEKPVLLKPGFHFGLWSILPAIVAIGLCLLTREPITALLGGTIMGYCRLSLLDFQLSLQPFIARAYRGSSVFNQHVIFRDWTDQFVHIQYILTEVKTVGAIEIDVCPSDR